MPTCKITEVSQSDYDRARADFEKDVLSEYKEDFKTKNGLVIILAVVDNQGPQGTMEDSKHIVETFGSSTLNFAVWKIHFPTKDLKIPAIMKVAATYDKYPESINKIFVYFTGHGGTTDDRRKYVIPHSMELRKPRSYIEDDMIMFFEPSLGCTLGPNVSRVFLFDCCLSKSNTGEPKAPIVKDVSSVSQPLVIAHATSMGKAAGGQFNTGGKWTERLCINIKDYPFLPLSFLLDKTWDDVVERNVKKEAQGPHYLYYMGPLFLKEEYRELYYRLNSTAAVNSGIPPSQASLGGEGGTTDHTPLTISDNFRDIDDIMDYRPEQRDLKDAILDDLNNSEYHIWNDRFGKRLKGPNRSQLSMLSEPAFLIDIFYDEDSGGPFHITWGSVLHALQSPTPLKTKSGQKMAATLREYLNREEVFYKYKK